ncbi:MAG TPA: c-type cytochrome, partial [Pirellulales bacterium]
RKDNVAETLSAVVLASDRPGRDVLVERLLTMAAGFGEQNAVRDVLRRIAAADAPLKCAAHFRAIHTVLRMAARQGISLDKLADAATRRGLEQLHAEARRIANSSEARDQRWKTAAPWLLAQGLGDDAADLKLLDPAMQAGQPADVQIAVVEALSASREPKVAELLLSGWNGYAPSLRARVFAAIKSRDAWVGELLDRVEQGRLSAADFDARSRAELAALKNEALRRRAEKLLAVTPNADRRRVVESYQPVVHMHGDAGRGKDVFTKRCSQCHFYEGIGHRVGPEIASIKDRSPAALIIAILDPNRSVESRYVEYVAELADGRTFSGIVAEETTTSITLVGPEEKRQTILRSDIESLRSAGRSLMPEGLEKDLKPQDLADIIAFVGKSEPPREFAGNSPAVVKADSSGAIALGATRARIYGPRLIFEIKHQNLGWWVRPEDRAEWTCETLAAGKYRVTLDFACASEAAGNEFVLKIAGQEFRGKVASTGTWDDYQQNELGEVTLPAGPSEI